MVETGSLPATSKDQTVIDWKCQVKDLFIYLFAFVELEMEILGFC